MIHTREGARVAMCCLWYGNAKDRKLTVKSFKTFVTKICKEEYGHLVMLALFDVVDDTKLVQKAILDEMMKSLEDLAKDLYGRKVLLYLLAPRSPLHFYPDIIAILQQGNNNLHSKKDISVRRQELLTHVSRSFVDWVAQHIEEHIDDNALLVLITAIIQHVKCDPTLAMTAIVKLVAKPFIPDHSHIIDHPAGHLSMKRLILNDAQRVKQGESVLFSRILLDIVPASCLQSWTTCNRGCFVIISLLEVEQDDISSRVKQQLVTVQSSLSTRNFKGATVLLKKLSD
jgi:pumilio family protein 6